MSINAMLDLQKRNAGELPKYAWPGGYTLVYYCTNGDVICPDCAQKALSDPDEFPEYKPTEYSTYDEGPTMQCDSCQCDIESSYGDPDEVK